MEHDCTVYTYKKMEAEDKLVKVLTVNSEKKPFRLVFDFEEDQNYLEEIELPTGIEFITAFV
jgi:hypothetical protein